jgi:Domain of unknown function (DUF1707)
VTGEVSPAGPAGESRPELRASHADRDRVVEELRIAAGDGRLTAEELDERLETALTARTYQELAVLTADLPRPGAAAGLAQPKDVLRMVHRGGNAKQVGRWVVPKRMDVQVVGGNAKFDFTEAVITERTLKVDANLRGGNLIIITRPGVVVDTSGLEMTGGNIKNSNPWPDSPTDLTIEVKGHLFGGNLKVRKPRRTFLDWLLRRPASLARQLPR